MIRCFLPPTILKRKLGKCNCWAQIIIIMFHPILHIYHLRVPWSPNTQIATAWSKISETQSCLSPFCLLREIWPELPPSQFLPFNFPLEEWQRNERKWKFEKYDFRKKGESVNALAKFKGKMEVRDAFQAGNLHFTVNKSTAERGLIHTPYKYEIIKDKTSSTGIVWPWLAMFIISSVTARRKAYTTEGWR